MKDLSSLLKAHEQITRNHICEVEVNDYCALEANKRLLLRLSEVENSMITVYDFNKRNYLINSSKFKEKLGYLNALTDESMESFFKVIHPDDLSFVLDTGIKAMEFLKEQPSQEKKNYKLIYDFRIRNASGEYYNFIHQMIVLETDRKGEIWLSLIITDFVGDHVTHFTPQRKMYHLKTGEFCLFEADTPFNSGNLSKREIQVLKLISQGLVSEEISQRLFISVNTVNNHRQKILAKTNTRNTTQALLYAKRIGIF